MEPFTRVHTRRLKVWTIRICTPQQSKVGIHINLGLREQDSRMSTVQWGGRRGRWLDYRPGPDTSLTSLYTGGVWMEPSTRVHSMRSMEVWEIRTWTPQHSKVGALSNVIS